MSRVCAPSAVRTLDLPGTLRDAVRQHAEQTDGGNRERKRREPAKNKRVCPRP